MPIIVRNIEFSLGKPDTCLGDGKALAGRKP